MLLRLTFYLFKTSVMITLSGFIIICFGQKLNATPPQLCRPLNAVLTFKKGDSVLLMDIAMGNRESDCPIDYKILSEIKPNITIRLDNRKYIVPQYCVEKMSFDLHGIEVEFTDTGAVVSFGDSLKNLDKNEISERDIKVVQVHLDNNEVTCFNYQGPITP